MKQSLTNLAIFGAPPAFADPLHVGRPNVGCRESLIQRINDILDHNWLTNNGPYIQEFERKVAEFLGVKHCITLCNATMALGITARALGMKGEVLIPSFTFIATAHALQWQEITPVFCDIDPDTHNIDPACVEKMITPRTTGVIGVHLWGRPCQAEALTEIADRHGLKLMFDAAHAFGCSYKGEMIGNFGKAEVFSFHATKFFNTFEGGAITTNDDELAAKMRLMKNFGFSGYDNVIYVGTNGKMTEICAAMGLTGLESLDEFVEVNRKNYLLYKKLLEDLPGLKMVAYDESEKNNYQYIVFEIDEGLAGISRDFLIKILHAENVLARRYFYPGCHRMEPYQSYFPHNHMLLPATEQLVQRVISLPTGMSICETNIASICNIITYAIQNSKEIIEYSYV